MRILPGSHAPLFLNHAIIPVYTGGVYSLPLYGNITFPYRYGSIIIGLLNRYHSP